MISAEKKQAIIKEYARKEGDTGSPEVQIAILTARIKELTEHLKDFSRLMRQTLFILHWNMYFLKMWHI